MAANITLIHGDARHRSGTFDMIFTDPPYDMKGAELASILGRFDAQHLVMLTSMRQFLDFMQSSDWVLCFDFVFDGVMPKQSKNVQQPHYLHQTGVYLRKASAKSVFSRNRRKRSDVFEGNGYWPSIFHAPRNNTQVNGYAKNADCMADLLGSFDVNHVIDPFAGSGTTALAAFELDIRCTLIERDETAFNTLKKACAFMGFYVDIIEGQAA